MAYYQFQQEFDGSQPPISETEQRAASMAFDAGIMAVMAGGITVLRHDINGAGGRTSTVNLYNRAAGELITAQQAVDDGGVLFISTVRLMRLDGQRVLSDCEYLRNSGDEHWLRYGHKMDAVYRIDDTAGYRSYDRLDSGDILDRPHNERTERRVSDRQLPVLNNAPVGLSEVGALFEYLGNSRAAGESAYITDRQAWRLRGHNT